MIVRALRLDQRSHLKTRRVVFQILALNPISQMYPAGSLVTRYCPPKS